MFAFLIAEIIKVIRKCKLKQRFTKEIAFEFFFNGFVATKLVIHDYQQLQKYPCKYLQRHTFYTQVLNTIISSGYFINLNSDLVQLIIEFHQRFKNIQCELDSFFKLKDEEKERNVLVLQRQEKNAKLLFSDLQKSEKFKELKRKYYKKWKKKTNKRIDELSGIEKIKKEVNHGKIKKGKKP